MVYYLWEFCKISTKKECLNILNCAGEERILGKEDVSNFEVGFLSNRNIDIITHDDYFI